MSIFYRLCILDHIRCHARAMPRACGMFVYYRGFVKKIKIKITWRKIVAIHNIFKEKTTKLNF